MRKISVSGLRASSKQPLRTAVAEWVVLVVLVLFGSSTLVQAYVIPSGSMESTLLVGDHVFVDKLVYAPSDPVSKRLLPYSDVRRGDIIVFRYPLDLSQTYVKRAIGIPGDHIRIEDKRLILNGVEVHEPYVIHASNAVIESRDNFPGEPEMASSERVREMLDRHVVNGELIVPPGDYFSLGDNRDNSSDSRAWGFVPRENIVGKPVVIYWSYDATSEQLMEPGIGLSHVVDLAQHFFTKTRWGRTFRFLRAHPL